MVPRVPDQEGAIAEGPQFIGRWQAIQACERAGRGRVHVYDPENAVGTPVYVHAKVCVVDDVWVSVGSDNFNRRSWTHDSELSSAVLDTTLDDREPRDPGGTATAPASSPATCACGSRASTSTAPTTAARTTDLLDADSFVADAAGQRSTRSRPGTTAAGSAPARPAGCARTSRRRCRG